MQVKRLLVLALLACATIPAFADFCPTCIQNSAAPQDAQMNIGTATIRGTLNVSTLTIANLNIATVTASQFYGFGSGLLNLNGSRIASGTISTSVVSGLYYGITGVGALSTGTWNATPVGTQWGGTGKNFVSVGAGSIIYFDATGSMSTLSGGTPQAVLQTNGSAAPVWTSSPAVSGLNFYGLSLGSLLAGTLPSTIKVTSSSILSVDGASVIGNISGAAGSYFGPITVGQIGAGTLPNTVVASSITPTGVIKGTYGGPYLMPQYTVGVDGRLSYSTQTAIAIQPAQISPGPLPGGITVDPRQISTGTFPTTAVASSITATGVVPGTYGGPIQAAQFTVGYDGRISAASQFAIPGLSTFTALTNVDNNWSHAQTSQSSWTILNALQASSGVFTNTGNGNFSVTASSSVRLLAGGVRFADGTVLYSTAGIQASGGGVTIGTSAVAWVQDTFTANGSQKVFNLSQTPTSQTGLGISLILDGLTLNNPFDYTFSVPNVITFTTAPAADSSTFFAFYTVNTSTLPAAAFQNGNNLFTGSFNSFVYGVSVGSLTVVNGLTTSSGTFTQTGTGAFSLQTSSSIKINAGGVRFPDGTVLYSTSGITASGGSSISTQAINWVQDSFLAQANGVQKVFNLSQAPSNTNGFGVSVILDGLLQNNPTDYTFSAPNIITMATAPVQASNSFFAVYTVNTSTLPSAATQTGNNVFSGGANSFTYGVKVGSLAVTGGLTASSGTFTQTANYSVITSSGLSVPGTAGVYAGFFAGNGAALTNVAAASVAAANVTAGQLPAGVLLNAGSLDNGPVASSILPSTVAYTSSTNTFTAPQAINGAGLTASSATLTNTAGFGLVTSSGVRVASGVYAGFFSGNGAALTNVSATPTGAAGGDLTGTYPNPTIAAGAVTDSKVTLTTGAISSGQFGDNRVAITTGAVSGVFGDSKVNISTGGVTSGKFADNRVAVTTGAVSGIFGDDKVAISTGGVTSGKFGDNRVSITSGALTTPIQSSQNLTESSTMTVKGNAFSVGASSFTISGGSATVAYQLTAASFAGNGAALTGIPSTASIVGVYVQRAGDSMTGQLTIAASTLTVGGNAFSVGGSSFTVNGGSATLAYEFTPGWINMSGSSSTIVTNSSVTAGSYYGDASNLTGYIVSADSAVPAGNTSSVSSTANVSLATATATNFRGNRTIHATGTVSISNSSGATRTYTYQIFQDGVAIGSAYSESITNGNDNIGSIQAYVSPSSAGSHSYSINVKSSAANANQSANGREIFVMEY